MQSFKSPVDMRQLTIDQLITIGAIVRKYDARLEDVSPKTQIIQISHEFSSVEIHVIEEIKDFLGGTYEPKNKNHYVDPRLVRYRGNDNAIGNRVMDRIST